MLAHRRLRQGARLMPRFIAASVVIEAAGTKPKLIEEFVGRPGRR
jgi:hypothetical protein